MLNECRFAMFTKDYVDLAIFAQHDGGHALLELLTA